MNKSIIIDAEQNRKLFDWLYKNGWISENDKGDEYSASRTFESSKVSIKRYKTGTLVIQGNDVNPFFEKVIKAELGYDERKGKIPFFYELHAGADESGKGDLFGIMVSACVVADESAIRHWENMGLKECKSYSPETVNE